MESGRAGLDRSGTEALRELRAARRRRYVEGLDVMELLYRVYVGTIFGAIGLGVVAGVVAEAPATVEAVASLRVRGPALLGLGVAVLVLVGLRAGARGGPLAIEPAEVQHVLLAPIDRGVALRPAAARQLRVGALAGAAFGAVLGNFVFRRLPGSPVEWIGCLALFAALVPVAVLGSALLASGHRLRPRVATAAGLLLLAWSGLDVVLGWTTSPATALGEMATLPLQDGVRIWLAAAGLAFPLALVAVGLAGVGGILLEAARRRATLVAELRFSAAVQDLRTVVLLRRQLASERPRRRPWLELAPGRGAYPVWRRGWQSFLRWPLARIARALLVAVAAGVLAAGAWAGATLALFLPGLLLFVVALDLVEPLAQESDHPTRRQLLPVAPGSLISRHLAAPTLAVALTVVAGCFGATAVGANAATALGVGALLVLPLALVLTCCAAISATADPYAYLFTPEIGFAVSAAPLLASSLLVGMPLLAAREAERGGGTALAAAAGSVFALAIAAAVLVSVLTRRFTKRDTVAA
jgi:hypothetical protein